jgi:hypothetical protein
MQPDPESSPKSRVKSQSKFLLICSIVNILIFPLCVGLEVNLRNYTVFDWLFFTSFIASVSRS